MAIEPTRAALPGLENKQFDATANAKCDLRVNFRGMWGHVWHVGTHRCASPLLESFSRGSLIGQKRPFN